MADPKEELIRSLAAVCRALHVRFTLDGKAIGYEDVFSHQGLLPGFAKRADQLASLTIGYGLGFNFQDDSEARLGNVVSLDDSTPNSLRLMYITDIIQQLIDSSISRESVSLDELLYD